MTLPTRPCARAAWLSLLVAATLFTGCAGNIAMTQAEQMARAGQPDEAVALLAEASRQAPDDVALRATLIRQRTALVNQWLYEAESARASNRLADVNAILLRLEALQPKNPRVEALRTELARAARQQAWLDEARQALAAGNTAIAEARVQQVLAEAPGHPGARTLQLRLREKAHFDAPPQALGAAYQKPVTIEFREAPLRSVLESLGRSSGVNFAFDKEVRPDAKVSVYLKDVSIDEALKVILATQQLERKLLNDSTVLIYPATQAKQREHQELVTRSFYLNNADAKQAQNLVRTIAKTRDMFIDERLNLLVMRDSPEVMRLAEQLIATLDLPEPEVMLEVEVMEIASSQLDEIGLQWPGQASFGIPGVTGQVAIGDRGSFRGSIANPALVATLRDTTSRSNVLANPRLRARNREKAKILIGEKLPVFTTTSTANVGVSTSISYLDIGLKLEVEPTVQLDNDVLIKINLEVSSLISKVTGPEGSTGYEIGTRQASTALRLRDGETQVLAGLIQDQDSKNIAGIPGLSDAPVVGRLFGLHSDTRSKTEVVLLITPRVLRNIGLPDANVTMLASGVDANAGAASVRLTSSAKVGVPLSGGGPGASAGGGGGAAVAPSAPSAPSATGAEATNASALLMISTSGAVDVGGTAAVTLQNRSAATLKGELDYDGTMLQSATGGDAGSSGRLAFVLAPGAEQVFLLRTLPGSTGQTLQVSAISVSASMADGQPAPAVRSEGDGQINVNAQ